MALLRNGTAQVAQTQQSEAFDLRNQLLVALKCRNVRVYLQTAYCKAYATRRGSAQAMIRLAEHALCTLLVLLPRGPASAGAPPASARAVRHILRAPLMRQCSAEECHASRAALMDLVFVLAIAYMRAGGQRWRDARAVLRSLSSGAAGIRCIVPGGGSRGFALSSLLAAAELGCGRIDSARLAVHSAPGGRGPFAEGTGAHVATPAGGQRAQAALLYLAAHLHEETALSSPTAPHLRPRALLIKCTTLGASRRRTVEALNTLGYVEARAGCRAAASRFLAAGGLAPCGDDALETGGAADGGNVYRAHAQCRTQQLLALRNFVSVAVRHRQRREVLALLNAALISDDGRQGLPNERQIRLPPGTETATLLAARPVAHALALTYADEGDHASAAEMLIRLLQNKDHASAAITDDAAYVLLECERYDDVLAVLSGGDGVARSLYRSDALLCLGRPDDARACIDKLLVQLDAMVETGEEGICDALRAQALNNRGLLRVCSGVKGGAIEAMRDFQAAMCLLRGDQRLQPAYNLALLLWRAAAPTGSSFQPAARNKMRRRCRDVNVHFRVEACKWWFHARGWAVGQSDSYYTKLLGQVERALLADHVERRSCTDVLVDPGQGWCISGEGLERTPRRGDNNFTKQCWQLDVMLLQFWQGIHVPAERPGGNKL